MLSIRFTSSFPALLVLVIVFLGITGDASGSDWSMFHRDIENSGATADEGPDSTGTLLWSYTFGDSATPSPIRASFAIVSDKLYATVLDSVYRFDVDDGGDGYDWSAFVGDTTTSTPAVSGNKVYVLSGADDRRLYCLYSSNGGLKWRTTFYSRAWNWPDTADDGFPVGSPTVVGDSAVFVGARDGNIYCVRTSYSGTNLNDGTIKWNTNLTKSDGLITGTPAYADNRIFIGAHIGNAGMYAEGGVFCLNATTGDTLWYHVYSPSWRYGPKSSPMVSGEYLYIGTDHTEGVANPTWTGSMYKFDTDADRAQEDVEVEPEDYLRTTCSIESTPTLYDGSLYFGYGDGFICCDASDLSTNWDELAGEIWSSPMIAKRPNSSDRFVYVTYNTKIYCLDPDYGDTIWDYEIGSAKYSSPVVSDGKLFVASDTGVLYCFSTSGEQRAAPPAVGGRVSLASPRLSDAYFSIQPNPTRGPTRIRLSQDILHPDRRLSVTILDVSGRVVRRWGIDGQEPMNAVVSWNLNNSFGDRVAPGVYFVHLRSGDLTLSRRPIVLLR